MATENSDVIGEDSSADVHLVLNGKGGGDPLRHPARILSGRDGFNWEKRGMTSKAAYQGYQVQKVADGVATEQQFFGPTVINAGHSRIRETQAEAVVFVVCRGVGLKTNTAAVDYIALYNGDKQTLAESLSVIQDTAAKILNELLPEKDVTRPEQQRQSALRNSSGSPPPSHLRAAAPRQPTIYPPHFRSGWRQKTRTPSTTRPRGIDKHNAGHAGT